MKKNYTQLFEILGYRFENEQLLMEALTHKSCKKRYNNERLEYLGDAVLDLIVGEYLYFHLADASEGELSKIRASLVNEAGFTKMAQALNLGEWIELSAAEERNHGRTKPSLLSNAFEALMGAIYLDDNLETVREIVHRMLETLYPKIDLNLFKDYKTVLQEITQARYGVTPVYELLSSSGPDHQKEFVIRLMINEKAYATGTGKSKKSAQQVAAQKTIAILTEEEVSC